VTENAAASSSTTLIAAIGLVLVGAVGAYVFVLNQRQQELLRAEEALVAEENAKAQAAAGACEHTLPEPERCPFCHPELVAELGECAEHSVPEALCTACRPFLIPAFQAQRDWCGGHGLPESQCVACKGGELPEGEEALPESSSLCAKHRVEEARCPFCTPSLIETMGECPGHEVPEALCSRCSPFLEAAFRAEGDWCAEHGLPESQCQACGGGD
jgi:uncharacterized protein with PIN domain